MKLSDVVLACGTRLIDVDDVATLTAVRGHWMGRVRSFEFHPSGAKFDVPGNVPVGPEDVYADRAKAFAAAIHAGERMVERLKIEAAAVEGER